MTRAPGYAFFNARAMQPLPVPTSTMHAGANGSEEAMRSTISSVSGRGISTLGSTLSVRPWNSTVPRTYCTGSPVARRARSLCRDAASCGEIFLSGSSSGKLKPARLANTMRMMARSSPGPYSGCRAWRYSAANAPAVGISMAPKFACAGQLAAGRRNVRAMGSAADICGRYWGSSSAG